MKPMPLRYRISSWRQLPQCLSNNSVNLHIHVSDFVSGKDIRGFKISVEHDIYGTLFACLLNARGAIISRINIKPEDYLDDPIAYELTTEEILSSLSVFGFLIEYNPRENLSKDQLDYLVSLQGLHFDKLRVLNVHKANVAGADEFKLNIVVFDSSKHEQWLNNAYSPSEREFTESLIDGSAVNLTGVSETRNYRWDWLDYVANIDDIIRDNMKDDIDVG